MAGLVLVTVNPAYLSKELEYVLKQSQAVALVHETSYRGRQLLPMIEEVRSRLPLLRHVVNMEQLDDFCAAAPHGGKSLPEVTPRDPAMIQYTSGTTGFPKGALLVHRGLTNNARLGAWHNTSKMAWHRTPFTNQDRPLASGGKAVVSISAMPLFHTAGCALALLGSVSTFGTLVMLREFNPEVFLDLIEQERPHISLLVPTMLIAVLERQQQRPRDVSSLLVMASGASVVPSAVVERVRELFGVDFSIVYGQTETSPLLTGTRLGDSLEDSSHSIGRPFPHTSVKIAGLSNDSSSSFSPVPVNQVGEICARGYCLMEGYFGMEEATRKTIDRDGWLHTGDLGMMDERGFVYIKGRLKDMIIRGGENVYPREIEDVLFTHPLVSDCAVVGLPDDKYGEIVAAVITPKPDHLVLPDELRAHCHSQLSHYKVPVRWFECQQFPLTPSGKIQKFVLVEMILKGQLQPIPSSSSSSSSQNIHAKL